MTFPIYCMYQKIFMLFFWVQIISEINFYACCFPGPVNHISMAVVKFDVSGKPKSAKTHCSLPTMPIMWFCDLAVLQYYIGNALQGGHLYNNMNTLFIFFLINKFNRIEETPRASTYCVEVTSGTELENRFTSLMLWMNLLAPHSADLENLWAKFHLKQLHKIWT